MTEKFGMAKAFTRSWLFGAVRYSAAGEISLVEIFGWGPYKRVGSIKQIIGITLGRDKAGE